MNMDANLHQIRYCPNAGVFNFIRKGLMGHSNQEETTPELIERQDDLIKQVESCFLEGLVVYKVWFLGRCGSLID